MKLNGITRKIDELGRIVIPMEFRNKLEIMEGDMLEIFVKGESIVLRKYNSTCTFCNGDKDLIAFGDKLICSKCIEKIAKN